MADILDIDRHGGVAATYELLEDGWRPWQLTDAVREHTLVRVRQGWYCRPDTDVALQRAWRVGGVLGCRSGARTLGLWVPDSSHLHVSVPINAARLRRSDDRWTRRSASPEPGLTVHWAAERLDRLVATPLSCVTQMARCCSAELTVSAASAALRRGLMTSREWSTVLSSLPARLRSLLREADPRFESITEAIGGFRIRRLGIETRWQVDIAGVGRVDCLVGNALIIEFDGREFHDDPDAFERDRRRDARASARGYRVLRFSYRQVMQHWPQVRAAILGALARGDQWR